MDRRGLIYIIAQFDGITIDYWMQLQRIADRTNGGCSIDDALRVAYIVYRMLRPAQVSH